MKSRAPAAAVLGCLIVFAGIAVASPASAAVFGFYGSGGFGSSDWNDSYPQHFENNIDTRAWGAGIVFGTGTPAQALNYRISVGYEEISFQGDFENSDFTMHGVVVDQDLLINLTPRQGPLRVWFGPEFRLGLLSGSLDHGGGGDEDFFVFGLGPVMGVDFMIAPALGLSWKLGYLFSEYLGDNNSWTTYYGNSSIFEGQAYASLSILFSSWAGYREAPAPPQQPQPPQHYYPNHW
jgi:hypothetical protein